ncbi:MAG: hypothetical protein IJN86_00510 [Clostridia bacterium]|nr:hypothetical protein [Clostridia bacterium]
MESIYKLKRINPIAKVLIIVVIGLIIFYLLSSLFYSQATARRGYSSDLKEHIKYAIADKGYSALYSFMGKLYEIFESVICIAILEALMVIATWLLTAKFITMVAKETDFFMGALFAIPIVFLCAVAVPILYPKFYSGQLVTQPYHNITFYGMRLFALIAMMCLYKVFDNYLNKIKPAYWIAIALSLALSTSVKPSFFYGFALTLLIFLIIDFFKSIFKKEFKLGTLGHIILMGVVVFPSLYIMAKQVIHLFGPKEVARAASQSSGIAIAWGKPFLKAGIFTNVARLVCGMTFPTLVAFNNRKKLNRFEKFSYLMFFVQILVFAMLTETGKRANHGNFYWGVYSAGFFAFLAAVPRFLDNIRLFKEDKSKKGYLIAGFILLIAHMICSIMYFAIVQRGYSYLI